MEQCADFSLLVEGRPPSSIAAREELEGLPPGKELSDKFVFGLRGQDGRLLGVIESIRHYPDTRTWWLGLLLLAPDQRGKGMGATFYRAFERWVQAQGISRIALGVIEENHTGLEFWRAMGFRAVRKTEPRLFGDKSHAVHVMERTVPPPAASRLVFRGYRGAADHQHMADVRNASRWADGVEQVTLPEDIPIILSGLGNCDHLQDIVLVEAECGLVGFGVTEWFEEGDGIRAHYQTLFLRPDWRTPETLDHLFGAIEERAKEIAAAAAGERHVLRAEAYDSQPYLLDLYQREGYTPVRTFYSMLRPTLDDLPEVPLPAGLEVRPVRSDQHRQIWEAMRDAFSDYWAGTIWDDTRYEAWRQARTFRPELWKVAWDGEQVAGMVLASIDEEQNTHLGRHRGHAEPICVRRPWRRRGLARALLARSLVKLRASGMAEAALGVDAQGESGALSLYESLGFHIVKREIVYEKAV